VIDTGTNLDLGVYVGVLEFAGELLHCRQRCPRVLLGTPEIEFALCLLRGQMRTVARTT